jgi:hypothetical protein
MRSGRGMNWHASFSQNLSASQEPYPCPILLPQRGREGEGTENQTTPSLRNLRPLAPLRRTPHHAKFSVTPPPASDTSSQPLSLS